MRHVYECPMRWADLDLLGHVNNVTYVDYLQEARIDMLTHHAPVRGGEELGEGVVVVRHEVQFVRPLHLRSRPVRVECWVTEIRAATFTMAYEIVEDPGDAEDTEGSAAERVVYVRATTVLTPFVFAEERPRRLSAAEKEVLGRFLHDGPEPTAPLQALAPSEVGSAHRYPLAVRWSDVDAYGHVNNVKYVEYFQEARIKLFEDLGRDREAGRDEWSAVVVATTDIDYLRPVLYDRGAYEVRSWVSRVGRRSYDLGGEVRDAEGSVCARARVVLVSFDLDTERSAPMPAPMRTVLERAVP
ncbi:acyl-CoA thioesterase [Marmoricola endophyticus]|uniref:acyl-CoA thioesterase n=1 Tax=Marmoricola endophyticus TaxID=2040280 RepID=UPI001E599BB7|nr:thioesterase family protein [Marmoricola endophyticus]